MAWTSADDEAQKYMEAYNKAHPGPYKRKMPTGPLKLIWKIRKGKWVLVWNIDLSGIPVAWIEKTKQGYKATFLTQRQGPYHKYETRLSYYKNLYYKTLREAKALLEHETKDMAMRAMKQDPVGYKKWI